MCGIKIGSAWELMRFMLWRGVYCPSLSANCKAPLGLAAGACKVLDNIRYGVPDASEEEVLRAMREADLYDDAWLPIVALLW